MGPKIDIMRLPEFEVGQAVARMLLKRLDTRARHLPAEAIPLTYEPGETVSPVRH